jgi:hypothetical protein
MALPPAEQILWGTGFENVLDFDYPVALDSPRTWRRPAPGATRARNSAGVTDAAIYGYDYLLAGQARWFDRSRWGGGVGLQAFLDWAGQGNPFRFVPDKTVPDFYVDNCVLDSPFDAIEPQLEQADGSQTIDFVIRNQTVDFAQALRGLMLEYAPGMSLTDPVAATFSRSTVATRHAKGAQGQILNDAINALRDRHYIGGVRHTLLEGARTNGWSNSRAFDNAAWTKTNCTISANASVGPDGLSTVDHFTESTDGAPAIHSVSQASPAVADNTNQSTSFCLRAGTRTWCLVEARNKAGTFLNASFNLAAGTVGQVSGSSTGRIAGPFSSPVDGSPFYIVTLIWPSASGGTTPLVALYPATGDGTAAATYQGNGGVSLALFQGQFEADKLFPSSLIDPAGATRTADELSWSHPYVPQPVFFYYKGIWRSGLVDWTTLMNLGVFTSGVGQRIVLYGDVGGNLIFNHGDSSGSRPQPAYGDTFEVLGYVDSLGRARLIRSINGGAEDASSLSGTSEAYPASYTRPIFDLGHENGGAANKQVTVTAIAKYGPFTFGGKSIDTIAKARAV